MSPPNLRKLVVQGTRSLGYVVYDTATRENVSPGGDDSWPHRHLADKARDELEWSDSTAYVIGPRHIGGRYFCGYWRNEYTVLAIDRSDRSWRITEATDEEAAEGRSRTHCTSWDWNRDKVISQPDGASS